MNPAEIVKAINNGEQKEKYEEWTRHSDIGVRHTLARKGYFPEIFMKDPDSELESQY